MIATKFLLTSSTFYTTPAYHFWFDLNPTDTPRQIHVGSTSILRRYVKHQISTNFHFISTYFFDVISRIEKSTLFPSTFFDAMSMVEKSTLFPRTFYGVISLVETYALFPRTFLDVISLVEISTFFPRILFNVIPLVEKSTLFPLTFFDVILMVEKSTLFARTFFYEISMGKIRRHFWLSCKAMKTLDEVFLF